MIRKAFIALAVIMMGALAAPIYAHSQKAAITRVLFNPRTENLEIMHRFFLHDAEHAVKAIFGGDADIIGSEKTRAQFAAYVHERFEVQDGAGDDLALQLLGHEVEGKFLWVYQETPAPKTKALTMKHNALRDLWPSQINTVNVEGEHGIRTARFQGSVEIVTVDLTNQDHQH